MDTAVDIREKLLAGQPIHFNKNQPAKDRIVEAVWLREAALKSVRINLRNAVISGALDLKYLEFAEEVSVIGCEFRDPADFSYTVSKRNLILSGTAFRRGADFRSATMEYGARLNRASFLDGKACFVDLRVLGGFSAVGARLKNRVKADFNRARFDKYLIFRGAVFEGETNFDDSVSCFDAEFDSAQFKLKASFSDVKIKGNAHFQEAEFNDEVDFAGAEIGGDAGFQDARFMNPDKQVIFDAAKFGANLRFERTIFSGEVSMEYVHVAGGAEFLGARFQRKVSFNSSKIDGDAFFHAEAREGAVGAIFEEEVDLIGVSIGEYAQFDDAEFKGKVKFSDADIGGVASFKRAKFLHGSRPVFRRTSFRQVARFTEAVFGDSVSFRRTHFLAGAEFQRVEFHGEADYFGAGFASYADFRRARFINSDKRARFDSARIEGDALFFGAAFAGEAVFRHVHIGARAAFMSTIFNKKVNFSEARIESEAIFRKCTFENEALFEGSRIGGNADFERAVFKGEASFLTLHVLGQAEFGGVRFMKNVSLNSAKIGKDVFFRKQPDTKVPAATFGGEADFVGFLVGENAEFDGAVFTKKALFEGMEIGGEAGFERATFLPGGKASFNGVKFRRGAIFSGARFEDSVEFRNAEFSLDARFDGTTFVENTEFEASHFMGLARFNAGDKPNARGAEFHQVSFDHSHFELDALFDSAMFRGPASFRESSFRVVHFSLTGNVNEQDQFQGKVDLRGCTYDRIGAAWRPLLKLLEPYDRQPFLQLEKVLRQIGKDDDADDIYLERQRVERMQEFKNHEWGAWLTNWLYKLIAHYGVRPYRLIVVPVLLVVLGMFVFSTSGAVSPKDPKNTEVVEWLNHLENRLPLWEAFGVSLHEFLPVEVPFGSQVEASHFPVRIYYGIPPRFSHFRLVPATYATFFLRLPGWILVPLGLGALTGVLRRVAA